MLPILIPLAALVFAQQSPSVRCVLRPATSPSGRWEGSCGRSLSVSRVSAITTGRWRSDVQPSDVWAGEDNTNSRLELETYRDSRAGIAGILRTENGWYPVLRYRASADSIVFDIDMTRTVDPSDLDHAIVERADAILSSTAVWNRADDRQCPAGAPTVSIYCAMTRASMEVAGGIHHRRPAMQLVREIVDKRSAGRDYSHRLMDYNNDPRTTLADVHSLFVEALAAMRARGG